MHVQFCPSNQWGLPFSTMSAIQLWVYGDLASFPGPRVWEWANADSTHAHTKEARYGGPFVSKLSIQNCCLCAHKSRIYRLDGQQNRFDLYHIWLDHPRWSARARLDFMKIELIRATFDSIIRGGVHWLDSCQVQLDHPRWSKSTRFRRTAWRKWDLTPPRWTHGLAHT